FGRIGRNVVRAIYESGRSDIDIVAINDLGPVETNAHLMRYDSVHGRFPGEVTVAGDTIDVGGGPGAVTLDLRAADAGAFLRDAGVFTTGFGGALTLGVTQREAGVFAGELDIRDITIRDTPALMEMLQIASVVGVLDALSTGGITFNTIHAPFVLRPGTLELQPSRATGVSMAITMEGDYQLGGGALDLRGVFSPIYLLNGFAGNVPILGDILTGPRGEGIFGFTYSLRGSAEAPRVRVNPLSILAPGILRTLITGGNTGGRPASVREIEAEAREAETDR
ncbi:MAG: glyceraldehyde 3-phosphate dehydrogenase NAD-binding domain-containing protein, partial [Pseudomonadota bacterium]